MTHTYYLDITDSLLAQADEELRERIEHLRGDQVYVIHWMQGDSPRQAFASASSPRNAELILAIHEAGFGRNVDCGEATHWGTKDQLVDMVRDRCS